MLRKPEIKLSRGPLRLAAIRNRMPCARLGQAVTKKGNPKAVRRNRIKRIIREEFRLRRAALPEYDIVVQCFGELSDSQLRDALNALFDRLQREAGIAEQLT